MRLASLENQTLIVQVYNEAGGLCLENPYNGVVALSNDWGARQISEGVGILLKPRLKIKLLRTIYCIFASNSPI